MRCFQYAEEIKGKRRGLGSERAPAKTTAVQQGRKRKADKITKGVNPRGEKPLG